MDLLIQGLRIFPKPAFISTHNAYVEPLYLSFFDADFGDWLTVHRIISLLMRSNQTFSENLLVNFRNSLNKTQKRPSRSNPLNGLMYL